MALILDEISHTLCFLNLLVLIVGDSLVDYTENCKW